MSSPRDPWVAWALEGTAYVLVAACLLSRGHGPDVARVPLALAIGLLCVLPPLLAPKRPDAQLLARVALAIGLGLLVQLRLPVSLDALSWESPRHETLTVSTVGVLTAAMGALLIYQWISGPREGTAWHHARVALATVLLLVLFTLVTWPLLNRVLVATTEPEGRFYSETAGALSIVLEYGVLLAYALTVRPRARHLRLGAVVAAALAVRLWLPPSGVG